jgi:hypothetical protein
MRYPKLIILAPVKNLAVFGTTRQSAAKDSTHLKQRKISWFSGKPYYFSQLG